MTIHLTGFTVALVGVLGTACASPPTRGSPSSAVSLSSSPSIIAHDTIPAPSLAHSLYGVPQRVPVAVYLPPGYQTAAGSRYPVLYMLHGFPRTLGGKPVPDPQTRWLTSPFGVQALDSLITHGILGPLLVVVPKADGRYGEGSFYTNSAAGDWEGFVARDLVGYIDNHYRTLRNAASRGIAGASGGGYGALRLAMRHPMTFGAVYAQSPCCLGRAAFEYDEAAWQAALRLEQPGQLPDTLHPIANVLVGLAAAFSPNPDHPPFYFDWPFELVDSIRCPLEPAYSRWNANMLLEHLQRYAPNLRRLQGIGFDVGRGDQYHFIPLTTRALSRALTDLGITHTFEAYEGDHVNRRGERTVTRLLPFFAAHLRFDNKGGR
jgi:S-formylglutathione hydrolase